jgi:hypothetical protein
MATLGVNGPEDQRFERDVDEWEIIDWRSCEKQLQRLRQRIFKATRDGDWPKVRNLHEVPPVSRRLCYLGLAGSGWRVRFVSGSAGLPGLFVFVG